MVVAVVPVLGREPLVKHTIRRLVELVDKVVCVVENHVDRQICCDLGAFICNSYGNPLGKKWNDGFWEARQFNPDYVLYMGSSDWVSENWLEEMTRYDAEIIGTLDYHLLHLKYSPGVYKDNTHKYRCCYDLDMMRIGFIGRSVRHWKGYEGNRKGEPIGIGRLVRKDYLDRVGWNPFEPSLTMGLDYSMSQKAKSFKAIQSDKAQSLSISTSLWSNKHKKEGELIDNEYLDKWFPEALKLF